MNHTEKDFLSVSKIENRVFTIRNIQVMLDSHLAEMYDVEIKRLNEQVKRNIDRFPVFFRFQLTVQEWSDLRSKIAILKEEPGLRSQLATLKKSRGEHRKYLPYVFTEQGVAMLSAVLKSETAVQVSIRIMVAFVEMRKTLTGNADLLYRIDRVEKKQTEADQKFQQLFKALEKNVQHPERGIFFDGQVFDSWKFTSDLVRKADINIALIDNYIDDSVLGLLSKKKPSVSVDIYTRQITDRLKIDVSKFNSQYHGINLHLFDKAHDRFLMIDHHEVYHFGASLKDLGKKWFAFSRMDKEGLRVFEKLGI